MSPKNSEMMEKYGESIDGLLSEMYTRLVQLDSHLRLISVAQLSADNMAFGDSVELQAELITNLAEETKSTLREYLEMIKK